MAEIDVSQIPLEDLGLFPNDFYELAGLGVNVVADISKLEPAVLNKHAHVIWEAVERIRREACS